MVSESKFAESLRQAIAAERAEIALCGGRETPMSDDPKKTGLDRKLISLEEPHEVRDWTMSLRCTEDELREAVKAVGHSAEKVREYLKRK